MLNKFIRGSVWWADLDKVDTRYTNVQFGRRPVIILSNNKGNTYSRTVVAVPCTTKEDSLHLIHPQLEFGDKKTWACTEQIRVMDKEVFLDYIGTLDEYSMRAVEDALKIELGLDIQPKGSIEDRIMAELKRLSEVLESLDSTKREMVKHDIERDTELKQSLTKLSANISKYSGMSAVEKFNAKYNQTAENEQTEVKSKERKKNTKWTEDAKLKLIEGYDANPKDKVNRLRLMAEFGFPDVKRLQTYVSKFKKEYGL